MSNSEFCARWILDKEQGNDIRVLDYGCGSGEIVEKLKKRNVEAFGCDVFYEGGSYSKSVPPQLMGSVIRREADGLLVPPGNVDALTAALDRLMGDAALRVQFAARAVEARERFSMEQLGAEMRSFDYDPHEFIFARGP